jgi:hypothetical protein
MSRDAETSEPAEREPIERPEHGGRLLARMQELRGDTAVYTITVATPGESWEAFANVTELDGRIDASPWVPQSLPPSWLVQATHALLRSAWQRRRAGHPWPRRLARWRPAPGEADA